MIRYLTIDIETTGLVWSSRILSVAVCYRDGDNVVKKSWNIAATDLFHAQNSITYVRSQLEPLLAQADYVGGHNLSFDYSFLFKYGIIDPSMVMGKTLDTLILARMTAPFESVSLFNVADTLGIRDPQWAKMKARRGVLDKVDVETLLHYNETDTYYNLLVLEHLHEEALKIYTDTQLRDEGDFAIVVAKMRNTGIEVDPVKLERLITEYTTKRRFYLHNILILNKIEGGNDTTEIVKFIQRNRIPVGNYTDKGSIKTDESSLLEMMHWLLQTSKINPQQYPDTSNDYSLDEESFSKLSSDGQEVMTVLGGVLACRHYDKALSTWLLPLYDHTKEDGCVHALYTAAGAVSFRLTCSGPNLQAYPALDIWKPYANADYSQAEYRLMAMYARSSNLANAYQRGDDAHTGLAKILFGKEDISKSERKVAKAFNFASLYGAGIAELVQSSGMSEDRVKALQTRSRSVLPEIGTFTREVNKRWVERGYIQLWDGTRIWASEYDRKNREYKGANQLCQGGVAKLTARAMVRLDKQGIPILGQIHDSIQFPMDTDPDVIRNVMENTLDTKLENSTNPPIRMVADYEIKGVAKDSGYE